MILFLAGNRQASGASSSAYSDTSAPSSLTRPNNSRFSRGYTTTLPHPHGKRRSRAAPPSGRGCPAYRRGATNTANRREGAGRSGGRPAGAGAQGGAQRPPGGVYRLAVGVSGTGPPAPASCGRAHSYAPPLQAVVNPKPHAAGSRSPWVFGVPRILDPAYRLRRTSLPLAPVHSVRYGKPRPT
jgi:hypothetical protein